MGRALAHHDAVRRDLPSGTVTFLFTDVEGSTKLLHELGADEYAEALAEHRRILRKAFKAHGGVEVDTQGDAFFVAFPTAPGALEAVQEAKEALAPGPIQVRMGIHTGTPHLAAEGYVGEDVHKGARIAAAGHRGQVLLSKETYVLVVAEATDLGEHRLKDFAGPVWIFQLGSERFPPLKTISNTNLPRPAGSFVGREREVAELLALLQDGVRLLTLTGTGGSGKTRLAIEAAAELVPEFPNGVFWVGLAPLRDPVLVLETVAQTLGAKDSLVEHVGERKLLLLLDNFEQVVEAAPELSSLLSACPSLRLLVTSRELLRIQGEVEYAVPPLAEAEAVELFCARSQLGPDETVAELCRRLDSMPLAVELAAARTSVLSPTQILERLSQRLDLLRGGRDAEARQQTLRATIAWSHDLLDEDERRLFASLGVFDGGCTLEAAEAVGEADLDTLQSLVDKSLLRHANERFWMLETIREYAAERLGESGQAEELRRRHAHHLLALAEKAQAHLVGANQEEWLGRIDAERANVRAALGWALGGGDEPLGLKLASALGRFWWVRGSAEGLAWLERGLEQADVAPAVRAAALDAAGGTAWFVGDHERALRLFEEGLTIYRRLGDRAGTARMLTRIGPSLITIGRHEEAERVVEEAVAIDRELGHRDELALSLHILASIALERGDMQEASELYEESAALAREIGDSWQLAWDLHNLAEVALRQDDAQRASLRACEALALAREIGDDLVALICLGILSIAVAECGDVRRAGALWGAAERLDQELGETMWRKERPRLEEMLGERGPRFEQGVEEGRRLTLEEAVGIARAPTLTAPAP
jgi:predicted ATPase/class 3 adenylate cyclase